MTAYEPCLLLDHNIIMLVSIYYFIYLYVYINYQRPNKRNYIINCIVGKYTKIPIQV